LAEETLSTRVVFEGRAVKLRVDTVRTADGRRSTREIVEHAACISVVAVDANDNILLVRQFRQAIDKELLEIPAGGIDEGESSGEAVIREMREETGFRPGKVERLCGFYSTPGFCNEYLHLYLATDLTPAPLSAEDTPGIEVVRVPITQVTELINSGKIEDSKTIAGLLFYLEYRKNTE